MNHSDLKKQLSVITQETDRVADEKTRPIFNALLNIIELLMAENAELKKENQLLRNEINQLKGEKGQPRFRKQSKPTDHSSEEENKQAQKKKKTDNHFSIRYKILEIIVTDSFWNYLLNKKIIGYSSGT